MVESAKGLAIVAATCILARGTGSIKLRVVRFRLDGAVERIVFSTALGLGAMAYIVLGIGLLGHLRMGIGVAYALGAILTIAAVILQRRDLNPDKKRTMELSCCAKVCIVVIGLAMLATWIGSVAPPASDDWDSLAYHLADPKVYLSHDRIIPLWYESHSNFPFTMEMLYTMGLGLGSVTAAKGFHWACYVLAVLATMALARRFFRHDDEKQRFSPSALFAAMIFATIPMVLWEATSAYIDIGTALFFCLAIYAVFLWRERRQTAYAVVAGTFAGFAMGTKYTVVLYAAVLALIMLFDGFKAWAGGRRTLTDTLVYGLVALAVASPWYIKSYAWTRNPVYPFFYEVFDGKNWNQRNADVYRDSQKTFGMGRGWREAVLSPINVTVFPSAFNDRMSQDPKVIYLFSVGPLFLAAAAFLVGSKRAPRELWYIIAVIAVAWAAWFAQMQYARYLIALAPIASVAAGWLIWNGARRLGPVRGVVVGIVIAVGLLNVGILAHLVSLGRASVALGVESREIYLSRNLGIYDMASYANAHLPENAKIIMYQEVRGFYFDREYMWGNPEHHDLIPYETFKTSGEFVDGLRNQGVTHILTFDIAMPPCEQASGWVSLLYDAAFEGKIQCVHQQNGYSLFEIPGS